MPIEQGVGRLELQLLRVLSDNARLRRTANGACPMPACSPASAITVITSPWRAVYGAQS